MLTYLACFVLGACCGVAALALFSLADLGDDPFEGEG